MKFANHQRKRHTLVSGISASLAMAVCGMVAIPAANATVGPESRGGDSAAGTSSEAALGPLEEQADPSQPEEASPGVVPGDGQELPESEGPELPEPETPLEPLTPEGSEGTGEGAVPEATVPAEDPEAVGAAADTAAEVATPQVATLAVPQALAVQVKANGSFPAGVTRLHGTDRYATAAAVATRYSTGVPVAFVATGTDFPDALSAAAAAAKLGAPLLLTKSNSVPDVTSARLKTLKPKTIYVVGETGVISSGVESELSSIAPVTRLGGSTRYDTSIQVSKQAFSTASFAVIATGADFPDALSATGVAGIKAGPVLLIEGGAESVPSALMSELKRLKVSTVMIAGGTGVVSPAIESQLSSQGLKVSRLGGQDRYETATKINAAHFPKATTKTAFLAAGMNFPDALAGAALAGNLGAPVYITTASCVTKTVKSALDSLNPTSTVVLGGTGAVSAAAANRTLCVPPKPVTSPTLYSLSEFTFHGVINWNGYKFTYYSQSVLPGRGLSIPGRHVSKAGYVSDKDGYIVLAANRNIRKGTVYDTPFGAQGKVYDTCGGCSAKWLDVYTK